MTRMQQFQSVIDAWKRKDIEAVLGAMTDDVVWHYAAAIAPPARGKAEARAFIEAFGANIGEVRWRIFHHSETGDRLSSRAWTNILASTGSTSPRPMPA